MSGRNERLLITGTSLVCSLGHEPEEAARRLLAGESGLAPLSLAQFNLQEPAWFAPVGLDLRQELGGKGWRNHNRAALMACLAAKKLQADASLSGEAWRGEDTGLIMGYNHNLFSPEFKEAIKTRNLNLINPAFFLNISINAVASQVTIYMQLHAFAMTVTTGFLAGLEALDQAALALRSGRARWVMAGGAEEYNDQFCYSFHQAFRRDADAGQPAAICLGAPNQLSAGEGCGLLLMETETEARRRGARAKGEFLGSGLGVNPSAAGADPGAAESALHRALAQARLEPGQVGAIFLAANGHAGQDQAEAAAIRRVFGTEPPPAVALKGALGETYHAHGALAAVAALESLRLKTLPPTAHLSEPGLARALNLSSKSRPLNGRAAVVLALDQDQKAAAVVLGAAS